MSNINNGNNNNLHINKVIGKERKYIEIRSQYLALALSFLGFRFQKFGYGAGTKYSFEDSQLMQDTISKLMIMKKELHLVNLAK